MTQIMYVACIIIFGKIKMYKSKNQNEALGNGHQYRFLMRAEAGKKMTLFRTVESPHSELL